MRTVLAAVAVATMAALASTASAQSWRDRDDRPHGYNARDHYVYGVWIDRQQGQLEARFYNGLRTGQLSHAPARRFENALAEHRWREARYRRNGLSRSEYMDLSRRLDRLDAMMTAELYGRHRYRG